jgi:O-antigen/teichoic acid export membrane protein
VTFLTNNINYLFFSLLKYIEYAINAFIFIYIARIVTPEIYGAAANSFLIITYSGFLLFGINQVVVKWHSKSSYDVVKRFLITYTIGYSLSLVLLIFFLILFISDSDLRFYVAFIACSKMIAECFVTILRVRGKMLLINSIYLFSSIIFLFLFIIYVENIVQFFYCWALSSFLGACYAGTLFFIVEKNYYVSLRRWYCILMVNFRELIKDGLKFTLIAILGTFYLTIDRIFFIHLFHLPKELMGNVQISDNISNVMSLGLTSILFIITPNLISKVYNGSLTAIKFYSKAFYVILGILFFLGISYFPLIYLIKYILPNYRYIEGLLALYIILKSFNLFLFVPNVIAMAMSKEVVYIRSQLIWILIIIIALALLKFLHIEPIILMYFVPATILILTTLMQLSLYFYFKKATVL